MTSTVLEMALRDYAVTSRSVLLPDVQTRDFTGRAVLGVADLADTTLMVCLTMVEIDIHGQRIARAYREWTGGSTAVPELYWSGIARRVCVVLDVSRPVSIGATISY